jgi:dihydroflavonol-4-reductase
VKRAFLTGGSGFVGANLARVLLDEGWEVRALVRPSSDARNLSGLALEIVPGDLGDPDLADKIGPADAVFHVAAHYSLFRADRDALMRSNVGGTRNVLAAARAAGVPRTVYTSSVAAIGVKHGAVADETYQSPPERLIGAYKLSKYLAEREAMEAAGAGQDVVIVNPTTPIGAWDRKPTPTGEIFVRFLTGNMPALVKTGLNIVDVLDVARGHLAAFERGKSGERYILGGENIELGELLQRVGRLVGRRAPTVTVPQWLPLGVAWFEESILARAGRAPKISIDSVRMSQESMYYDASKARLQLGFAPGPIDTAIRTAVEWFDGNGYLGSHGSPARTAAPR